MWLRWLVELVTGRTENSGYNARCFWCFEEGLVGIW